MKNNKSIKAKQCLSKMNNLKSSDKNKILKELIIELEKNKENIFKANKKDVLEVKKNNPDQDVDRLIINEERLKGIIKQIEDVILLKDYVGEEILRKKMDTGIEISKVKVPIGVIFMFYESRPNVTIDASVLAFKSGNSIILKGGKEAKNSNNILVKIFKNVLKKYSLEDCIQNIGSGNSNREEILSLLNDRKNIDLVIPRGSKKLINFIVENSKIPFIETGASVVHTYIDEYAYYQKAEEIILNEKTRRVSVCNALDTILIHEKNSGKFLDKIVNLLKENKVRIHFDDKKFEKRFNQKKETEDIFKKEWLDYDVSIKIVKNISEALEHISKYSDGHSESIITEDERNAEKFLNNVDSACVYWNTSTAFSDGGEFGLGAEIGISTQKLHTRGPFALESLLTTK